MHYYVVTEIKTDVADKKVLKELLITLNVGI